MQLCVVVREPYEKVFVEKMNEYLPAYTVSSSGRIPPNDKDCGEWWAICVRTGKE